MRLKIYKNSFKIICSKNKINTHLFRNVHTATKDAPQKSENIEENYCLTLVQKNDHENYLCTLLLNEKLRRHAFALRAFNVEVAKSSLNVSEELIGKMRLQFWFDSIDKCFDNNNSYIADHPVLSELKKTVNTNKITKLYLKRLVTARNHPPNEQFVTLQQLEEYAQHSFGSILFMLAELSDVRDMQVDHAISHLGKAQGLATLLRSIPYTKRGQPVCIPQEILMKHGVSQERIIRDAANDKGVEECVFEVAGAAHQHLEKARQLADKVPKSLREIFLPAVPVERYLERLRRANFSLTHQSCLQRDSLLPISLYWNKLLKKF